MRTRALAANVALAAASGLLSLVLGVVVVEAWAWTHLQTDTRWHDPNTRFDARLGWRPIASRHVDAWGGVSANSLGFRSPEPVPDRPTALLAGDSVAWGFGVGDEQSLGYVLEERISSLGVQVQNAAVSGYGLDQSWLLLDESLDRVPDPVWVVLVLTAANDLQDTATNERWGKRKPLFEPVQGSLVLVGPPLRKHCLRNLISNSYLLNGLINRFPRVWVATSWLAGDVVLAPPDALRVFDRLLGAVQERVAGAGARLTVVLAPSRADLAGESGSLRELRQLLARRGIQELDLKRMIEGSGMGPGGWFVDEMHLSPEGLRRIAERLGDDFAAAVARGEVRLPSASAVLAGP